MSLSGKQRLPEYLAISLWITSDVMSPETVTQMVGIVPSHVRTRGTPIPRLGINRRPEFDHHEWQVREQLDVQPGEYIGKCSEEFITQFFDKIKTATANIRELSENHSVSISLVYQAHTMPYIGLTRDNIQTIAALGASLNYDILLGAGTE
jgi:hypothetical protein